MHTGKCFLYLSKKDDDIWKISFHDETSGCLFLELEIPMTEMTKLLRRGIARDGCYNFQEDAPLGKTKEVKTEIVPVISCSYENIYQESLTAALAPFEVDGWKANRADADNLSRTVKIADGARHMNITFTRYLDPETQS